MRQLAVLLARPFFSSMQTHRNARCLCAVLLCSTGVLRDSGGEQWWWEVNAGHDDLKGLFHPEWLYNQHFMAVTASWVAQDYSHCRQMPPWQKLRGLKKNSSHAREEKILLGNQDYITRFYKIKKQTNNKTNKELWDQDNQIMATSEPRSGDQGI